MRCPSCSFEESKVVDSRPTDDNMTIRRRRECLSCGYRFTTYERLGENPLSVLKSDGSSEIFDREKLFRGLSIACAKRPVPPERLWALIDDIENELRAKQATAVKSKELGEMALERLRDIDDVAFVRFASVYKDFKDKNEFADFLESMEI